MVHLRWIARKWSLPAASTGVEQEAALGLTAESLELADQATRSGDPEDAGSGRRASIARELYPLLRNMLRGAKGWPIVRLVIAIVLVLVANMFLTSTRQPANDAVFTGPE